MDRKELETLIANVLDEMNIQSNEPKEEELNLICETDSEIITDSERKIDNKEEYIEEQNDECLLDIADMNIMDQYLVEDPYDGEGYMELKHYSPCRLGIGKAGARYKTLPYLQFRAAHSAAQDAVFSNVDEEFLKRQGLFMTKSRCSNKDEFLTRPDLGRRLDEESVKLIKEKCVMNPEVQIFVADGLSSAAVEANTEDVLASIMQGLESSGIKVGTPFFTKFGRVGTMDEVSEITGAEVTCQLVGERPGLITATSMSAYVAYKATIGMPEARRTVVSNIHTSGTIPAEAGAHIAEIIKEILEKKASGIELKEV